MSISLKNLFIGQLTNANVAVYTPAAAGISAKINSVSVYNSDASDHTLDAYIVASGGAGAAATSNQIYNDKLVPAGTSISLDLLVDKNIVGAGSLVMKADASAVLTVVASGVETS